MNYDKLRLAEANFLQRYPGVFSDPAMASIRKRHDIDKLAKWSVISVVPIYFAPRKEAFVKPTAAKGILRFLEVEDLVYKPMPSWEFSQRYRRLLDEIGRVVVPTLAPNNAALSGFMMSVL